MKRWYLAASLAVLLGGCGDNDDETTSVAKKSIPLDQVPAIVMKAAQDAAPGVTFYAAFKDKFEGKDSIELKGKTTSGKIKEVEVSPEGKFLGME